MSSLASHLQKIDLHFPSESISESSIIVAESLVGIIGVCLVLYVSRTDDSARTRLVWSLCLADFLLVSNAFVTSVMNLAAGKFSLSVLGCQMQAFLNYSSGFLSILSLVAITLERYCSINLRMDLAPRGAAALSILIWSTCLLVMSIVIFGVGSRENSSLVALGSSKTFCVVAFWESAAEVRAATIISLSVILLSIGIIAVSYIQIYTKYAKAMEKKKKGKSKLGKSKIEANEHKLLVKSIILVGFFSFSYSPLACSIIYELTTGVPAMPTFNGIAMILIVFNSAVNPLLLITLDARFKNELISIFGYDGRKHKNPFKLAANDIPQEGSRMVVDGKAEMNANPIIDTNPPKLKGKNSDSLSDLKTQSASKSRTRSLAITEPLKEEIEGMSTSCQQKRKSIEIQAQSNMLVSGPEEENGGRSSAVEGEANQVPKSENLPADHEAKSTKVKSYRKQTEDGKMVSFNLSSTGSYYFNSAKPAEIVPSQSGSNLSIRIDDEVKAVGLKKPIDTGSSSNSYAGHKRDKSKSHTNSRASSSRRRSSIQILLDYNFIIPKVNPSDIIEEEEGEDIDALEEIAFDGHPMSEIEDRAGSKVINDDAPS